MSNELLDLLSLSHLSAVDAETTLKKIVTDNLVLMRADELARRQWIVAAVRSLHLLERAALAKRCAPTPTPVAAVWSVVNHEASNDPDVRHAVRASCSRCNKLLYFSAPRPWVETGKNSSGGLTIKQHGVTRKDVERAVESLKFPHCAGIEPGPLHIREWWKNYCMTLMSE